MKFLKKTLAISMLSLFLISSSFTYVDLLVVDEPIIGHH